MIHHMRTNIEFSTCSIRQHSKNSWVLEELGSLRLEMPNLFIKACLKSLASSADIDKHIHTESLVSSCSLIHCSTPLRIQTSYLFRPLNCSFVLWTGLCASKCQLAECISSQFTKIVTVKRSVWSELTPLTFSKMAKLTVFKGMIYECCVTPELPFDYGFGLAAEPLLANYWEGNELAPCEIW